MMDPIERAGQNAFLKGEIYKNPYSLNSDEWNRYERGWTQAEKKSAIGLLPDPPRKQDNHFHDMRPRAKEPVYRPPADQDTAEAYRKLKG